MSEKVRDIYCPSCKQKQITLYKISDDNKLKKQTKIRVCTNPRCSLYIDTKKVDTWSRE